MLCRQVDYGIIFALCPWKYKEDDTIAVIQAATESVFDPCISMGL